MTADLGRGHRIEATPAAPTGIFDDRQLLTRGWSDDERTALFSVTARRVHRLP